MFYQALPLKWKSHICLAKTQALSVEPMQILRAEKALCDAGSTDPTYSALSPTKYTQKTGISYAGPGDCLNPIQQPPCTGSQSCGSGCVYCFQGGQSTTGPDTCKRFKAPGVRACVSYLDHAQSLYSGEINVKCPF